jgi:hypothetical protein
MMSREETSMSTTMTSTTIKVDGTEHTVTVPEDVSVGVCPERHRSGHHVRVATRWETECIRCGEPIPSGAVGLATWDDDRRCNVGGLNYQHGCGGWNGPVEEWVMWDPDGLDTLQDAIDEAVEMLREAVAAESGERR